MLYSLLGSLFLAYFYQNSFTLNIHGNGGFIGNYLNRVIFNNLIISYEDFFFFFLSISTIILFFISINFNIKSFYLFLINLFKTKERNYTKENEIINEYIPQEEIKNLIQEDLPFIKAEKNQINKTSFEFPSIELLKFPPKKG